MFVQGWRHTWATLADALSPPVSFLVRITCSYSKMWRRHRRLCSASGLASWNWKTSTARWSWSSGSAWRSLVCIVDVLLDTSLGVKWKVLSAAAQSLANLYMTVFAWQRRPQSSVKKKNASSKSWLRWWTWGTPWSCSWRRRGWRRSVRSRRPSAWGRLSAIPRREHRSTGSNQPPRPSWFRLCVTFFQRQNRHTHTHTHSVFSQPGQRVRANVPACPPEGELRLLGQRILGQRLTRTHRWWSGPALGLCLVCGKQLRGDLIDQTHSILVF